MEHNFLTYKIGAVLLPGTAAGSHVIMYVKAPGAVLFEGINNSFPQTRNERMTHMRRYNAYKL